VGGEGAHAARLRRGPAPVGSCLAALGVELVGMSRNVTEQVQPMGCVPLVIPRGLDRAVAQAPRLVEPAEQQIGATEPGEAPVGPAADPPRRLTFEELLAFPDSLERLACLAEL
jgi:hypothetical protein